LISSCAFIAAKKISQRPILHISCRALKQFRTIAPFLGISTSSIHDGIAQGTEGSAFKINLGALSVGDVTSFDYDFLTSDLTRSDFAF